MLVMDLGIKHKIVEEGKNDQKNISYNINNKTWTKNKINLLQYQKGHMHTKKWIKKIPHTCAVEANSISQATKNSCLP